MSKQERRQIPAKVYKGRQTRIPIDMMHQPPSRLANDDTEAWKAYWGAQNQPWRTEPKVDIERQKYLAEHRTIVPDIEKGIYPFRGIKLSRADVEWLLEIHENGGGPVDWSNAQQRYRHGLDLRGADLSNVDLHGLPLSRLRGGLGWDDVMNRKTIVDGIPAAIHLEKANLEGAHLEEADFYCAYMEGAVFTSAQLQRAFLSKAHLEGGHFLYTDLERADLSYAHLEGSYFEAAHLERTDLFDAHLEGTYLGDARLEDAILRDAHLEGADLRNAHLEGTFLEQAHFEGKVLPAEVVEHVRLGLEVELFPEVAPPANLIGVFFDSATKLDGAILGDNELGFVSLADVSWGSINLAVQDWSSVKMLGDEREACKSIDSDGERKEKLYRLIQYRSAVRANRQLAITLQSQGLNEDAARFAYRAQVLQRTVFKLQKKFRQYLFSLFLDLLTGYGYKPERSFLAYLLVITAFATAYFIIGHTVGPSLSPSGSVVFSMTSFHGRGFFPGGIGLDDPLTVFAAIEAFVGLLIEVTFIATLTQRLFGK